ncbi:MAG: serine/threonine protein kinase [Deltaproteobacteria bacterium]|nr:serine/threonine protein kinase [Deltaproteobacteria bacterium]
MPSASAYPARIGHDNICEVFDFGSDENGLPFFVMPLLRGAALSAVIQESGPFPPRRALDIAKQVLAALVAAHAAGIVHRDLKPDNVFLTTVGDRKDFAKVLDFGISKVMRTPTGAGNLTRTGSVLGTPNYMAPEQARGAKDVDHRVDIYAVGVILYEMLTAHRPFGGETFNEILWNIWNDPVVPLRAHRPEIPREVEDLVLRAMSRDRDKRHPTAETLRRDIAALEESLSTASSIPLATMATMQASAGAAPAASPPGGPTPFQAAWGPTPPPPGVTPPPTPPPRAAAPAPDTAATPASESGAAVLQFAPVTMAPTPHAGTLAAYTVSHDRRPVRAWLVALLAVGAGVALVAALFLMRHGGTTSPSDAPAVPRAAPTAAAVPPPAAAEPTLHPAAPATSAPDATSAHAATQPVPPASLADAPPISPAPPDAAPDAAPPATPHARIRLTGVPPGSLVLVDGNPMPGPEFDILPAPGKRVALEVRADGYRPWRGAVVADGPKTVPVTLRRPAGGTPAARRDADTTRSADAGSGIQAVVVVTQVDAGRPARDARGTADGTVSTWGAVP